MTEEHCAVEMAFMVVERGKDVQSHDLVYCFHRQFR